VELSLLQLLIFAGVPLMLGGSILRALGIGFRTDPIAYPGWCWMAGTLAVAALELLRLVAGLGAPGSVIGMAVALAAALCWRARSTPVLADDELAAERSGRAERAFFYLALALVLAATARRILAASLSVVIANDEAHTWSLRAKYLFDGGFDAAYASAIAKGDFNNAIYPLLNPLLQVWVFDCAGAVTHHANRLPIQLCTVALLLCAASAFRRASRPWIAALLLILLATCPPLEVTVRRIFADVMVGLSALVAADALRRGARTPRAAWLGLGALAVTFLVWSKREGLLLLGAAALAWALCAWGRGELRRRPVPRRAPPLLVLLGTTFHNAKFGAEGSWEIDAEIFGRAWDRLDENLPLVLTFFGRLVVRISLHAIPLVVVVLAVLAPLVRPKPRAGVLAFVPLASLLFALTLVVAFVQGAPEKLLPNACQRVVFQIFPLMCLWIACVLGELLGSGAAGAPERAGDAGAITRGAEPTAAGPRRPSS
jgi:hypothetical protein